MGTLRFGAGAARGRDEDAPIPTVAPTFEGTRTVVGADVEPQAYVRALTTYGFPADDPARGNLRLQLALHQRAAPFLSRPMNATPNDTTLMPDDYVASHDAEAPLLDVRTPDKFAGVHLAGAHNVDAQSPGFQDQISALRLGDGPVYLYCRSGNRSGKATAILRQMGHAGAVNIGGFDALAAAGAETA